MNFEIESFSKAGKLISKTMRTMKFTWLALGIYFRIKSEPNNTKSMGNKRQMC